MTAVSLFACLFIAVVISQKVQHRLDFVLQYEINCQISGLSRSALLVLDLGDKTAAGVPYNCTGKASSNDLKTLITGKGEVSETFKKLTGSISTWTCHGISDPKVHFVACLVSLVAFDGKREVDLWRPPNAPRPCVALRRRGTLGTTEWQAQRD